MAYFHFGEIKLLPPDKECGAKTPALFQVVLQLPFRYGSTRGEGFDSWLHFRVSAFTSAACFDKASTVVKVGSPVSGFLESTNSKEHFGAQLTGWDTCPASEWKLSDGRSFPAKIELNSNVLSALPQLDRGNFPIARAPGLIGCFPRPIPTYITYGYFTAPVMPKYHFDERAAEMTADTSACNRRQQDPNPPPPSANSAERRLHQRWMQRQNDQAFRRARGGGRSA